MLAALKATAAVGGVSLIAILAIWWQLGNAQDEADAQRERAAALRAQLDQASQAAARNADRASELADEIDQRDQILTDLADKLEARRAETQTLLTELQEANRVASVEYRDCLTMPVPDSVRSLIRVRNDTGAGDRSGDRGPDRARPSTGQPDAALPGA